jgi:hypothetical protein
MARNMVLAVILAFVLALALTGCGEVITGASYTFRFKVQNDSAETITKVQFLNGSNRKALVLRTLPSINLTTNKSSRRLPII